MSKEKKKDDLLKNFVPINRKFFDHPFWREKRPFSKSEAWLDLIREARFDESEATELIGGRMVSWSRGQLPGSLRFLMQKWNWKSTHKVDDFLKLLEKERMISRHQCEGQTIISLLNFDYYNGGGQQKERKREQQNPPPQSVLPDSGDTIRNGNGNSRGTPAEQTGNKTNTVNTGKTGYIPNPDFSEEQYDEFMAVLDWIEKNAPLVMKMQEPLTIDQYFKLCEKVGVNTIPKYLTRMHNWKDLRKKNVSAYRTLLNWYERDNEKITAK